MKTIDRCSICLEGTYRDDDRCGQCFCPRGTERLKRPAARDAVPPLVSEFDREFPYALAAGCGFGLIVLAVLAMYVAVWCHWIGGAR
jgi:hypothetical protein